MSPLVTTPARFGSRRSGTIALPRVLGWLTILCVVVTAFAPVRAQEESEAVRERIKREVERRLEEQRRDIMRELDEILRRALDDASTDSRRVTELEEEVARLRRTVRSLREKMGEDAPAPPSSGQPFLGVGFSDTDGGILIEMVLDRSPAARARLREGDLVVRVDGEPASEAVFDRLMDSKRPGDRLGLEIKRRGASGMMTIETAAQLADRQEFEEAIRQLQGGGATDAEPEPMRPVDPEPPAERVKLGIRLGEDMVVMRVTPGSNAAEAGLRQGDVFLAFDGRKVTTTEGVADILGILRAGAETTMEYRRGDTTFTAQLRLARGDRSARLLRLEEEKAPASASDAPSGRPYLGVEIEPGGRGLEVFAVIRGSTAHRAGVRAGDVLLSFNGARLMENDHLREALGQVSVGDRVEIVVERGRRELRLAAEIHVRPDGDPERITGGDHDHDGHDHDGHDHDGGEHDDADHDDADHDGHDHDGDHDHASAERTPATAVLVTRTEEAPSDDPTVAPVSRPAPAAVEAAEVVAPQSSDQPMVAVVSAPRSAPRASLGVVAVLDAGRVEIESILPNSAAGAAGVRPGDVIVECDGRPVRGFEDLESCLADAHEGDHLTVSVERAEGTRRFQVALAPIEPKHVPALRAPRTGRPYLGVDLEEHPGYLRVARVIPGGPAERAGIRVGDELVELPSSSPLTFGALRSLLGEHRPGDRVQWSIRRGGSVVPIELILGSAPARPNE